MSKYEEYRKFDKDQIENMLKVGFEIIPLDKVHKNSNILVGSRYREQKAIISNYEIVTIGEVATLVSGYGFPMALQGQTGVIPFYKVGDMNSVGNEIEMHNSRNYVSMEVAQEQKWITSPKGTVIFPKIGAAIATNKKRILSEPAIFDNNVMGIICSERIIPKFMWYVLNSIDISNWATRANPPSISKDIVLEQRIPLPPLEIQRQIVFELDKYQRIIGGAQSVIDNYQPKLFYRSKEFKTLEDIAIFKPSKDEIKSFSGDTDVSFVPMATLNTFDASFEINETRKLEAVSTGFTYFKNDDILLAKITPCFENGKAGIARNLKNGIGFGSTEYIVIRADTSIVYPEWIFYHINTREFIDGGKPFMTGTAGQQRIDINYVKQYQIPVPSLDEQKKLLDEIHREQSLIEPSKEVVRTFNAKIKARIKEIWGE